jgi:hypothetical protein
MAAGLVPGSAVDMKTRRAVRSNRGYGLLPGRSPALSILLASVLTRLGDHGALVRAEEAALGLYGQRDPGTVLRLTQDARQIAGGAPSLGLALVVCSQAKALTLLGRRPEAVRTLHAYRDLAGSAPAPGGIMPGYWQGGQMHFAENMILAGTGDEPGADEAGRHVLASANPDYQLPAQISLSDRACPWRH